MTKLTLSIDETVVEEAKQMAEASGTSVSAMFTRFVKSMAASRRNPPAVGPLTQAATGLMKPSPDKDYKEHLTEALVEKYQSTP